MIGEEFAAVLAAAQDGSEAAFSVLWRDANPALLRYLRVAAPGAAEDAPSSQPTGHPGDKPTSHPTGKPTSHPGKSTSHPGDKPTSHPTGQPTSHPTGQPN